MGDNVRLWMGAYKRMSDKECGTGNSGVSVIECVMTIRNYHLFTNWLMPVGCRQCSLKIELSSVLLRLAVFGLTDCGVHHSISENYKWMWECPSVEKCLDTGVFLESFLTDAMCSYILFLNALPVSPTYIFTLFERKIP